MSDAVGVPAEEWRRTSPLSFIVGAILSLRSAAFPAFAALIGTGAIRQGWVVIVPTLLAIGFFSGLFSYLSWRRFRYRIGESDIRVERGLLNRTARSVPYDRIQDVSLEQSLVPRLFGMVDVKFETGAGGKDEVRVRYVSAAEAEALRATIRDRKNPVAMPAAEPGETEEMSDTLFAMDLRRLATFGLFEFSLVAIAVLAGAAQQFDFLKAIDIGNYKFWIGTLGGLGVSLQEAGLATQSIGLTLALVALLLIGLITGLMRTVLRDYGFRLEQTPKGLRRRRGLMTRTDVVMPVHRVQALKLRTGIVRRRFGWHGLSVVSLAQDAKAGNHIIVPFARMHEIAPVIAITGFALPTSDTAWRRPSRRHRGDRMSLLLIPLGVAALVLIYGRQWLELPLPAVWLGAAALVALAGTVILRAHYRWHHDRHCAEGKYIYVRHGWLAPRLDIASLEKLQSVEVIQGPIARRRGYADVKFGLAGGKLEIVGITVEDARSVRASILQSGAFV